jgi:drug/metabolite transporter (DMT)-like permease
MGRGISGEGDPASERKPPATYLLAIVAVLVLAIGVACVVYGEADDSPGLQLLGVLLVVGAVVLGVRLARRRR